MPAHCASISRRPVRQVAFSDTVEIIGTSTSTWLLRQPLEIPEGAFARHDFDVDHAFAEGQPDDGADRVHEISLDSGSDEDELAESEVDQASEIGLNPIANIAPSVSVQTHALVPPPRGSSLNWRGRVPTTTTTHQQAQNTVTAPAPTLRPLSPPPPYSTNPTSQTQSLDEIEAAANSDPVPSYNADIRPPAYIEALMSEREHDDDDGDSIILTDVYNDVLGWFQNFGRGVAAAWSGEWDAEN